MCIVNDDNAVVKNGRLKLWKVVCRDNKIGLWWGTGWHNITGIGKMYLLGVNIAKSFISRGKFLKQITHPGQFHCFFTRKEARRYMEHRYSVCSMFFKVKSKRTKIIRVCADSSDVIKVGRDESSDIRAISVSKMEIKSLKHQR
ncbi:hypothetical protein LCGC14_2184470 [marine sediment metagenome]|uniref:Uncharacterized protein n=1 Tax=marine sediment metagenome TaxID=412755 RepID=A0A0F9GH42_9ZZZZ